MKSEKFNLTQFEHPWPYNGSTDKFKTMLAIPGEKIAEIDFHNDIPDDLIVDRNNAIGRMIETLARTTNNPNRLAALKRAAAELMSANVELTGEDISEDHSADNQKAA